MFDFIYFYFSRGSDVSSAFLRYILVGYCEQRGCTDDFLTWLAWYSINYRALFQYNLSGRRRGGNVGKGRGINSDC